MNTPPTHRADPAESLLWEALSSIMRTLARITVALEKIEKRLDLIEKAAPSEEDAIPGSIDRLKELLVAVQKIAPPGESIRRDEVLTMIENRIKFPYYRRIFHNEYQGH